MYTATLLQYGKKYQGSGNTAHAAISAIGTSGVIRGKAVLTLVNGENTKDRVLPPVLASRLFSKSPLVREMALKNTALLFDGI